MPLLRVPYTDPLPLPKIIPASAASTNGAVDALVRFLVAPPSPTLLRRRTIDRTVLLTGAGISVASGLADYRGTNGTYTRNKTFRPIYYSEFVSSHEARKRYWARSFLGWPSLQAARPNSVHHAIRRLGELDKLNAVITQNVDSFHPTAHPLLPTTELHGTLRTLTCLSCHTTHARTPFQHALSRLNPAWAAFLSEALASGALTQDPTSTSPAERARHGLRTNPDGDVDVAGAPYSTFRYPACPVCQSGGTVDSAGRAVRVAVDADGAWQEAGSTGGVLKPGVVMFGENIDSGAKMAAEEAIDAAARLLVLGTSLATYSAWRLVRRAVQGGLPVAVVNLGGVRGEEEIFARVLEREGNEGEFGVRCNESANEVLPEVVKRIEALRAGGGGAETAIGL